MWIKKKDKEIKNTHNAQQNHKFYDAGFVFGWGCKTVIPH